MGKSRYSFNVELKEGGSYLEEVWPTENALGVTRKWLQMEPDGEFVSIRLTVALQDGTCRTEGIRFPLDLFRQGARWAARVDR